MFLLRSVQDDKEGTLPIYQKITFIFEMDLSEVSEDRTCTPIWTDGVKGVQWVC